MKTTNSLLTALAAVALGFVVSPAAQAAAAPVVNWSHVKGGNQIEIFGKNFGTKGTVTVEGTAATVASWSSTVIEVTSPLTLPVTAEVAVTTAGGKAVAYLFNPITVLGSVAVDRDNTESVIAVSIDGGGNQAHVSPGAAVTVAFDYNVCVDCYLQLGFSTGAPQACLYSNGGAGHTVQTLTAPSTPGIYTILFDRNQNDCSQAVWDYGTPPPSQAIGAISVY